MMEPLRHEGREGWRMGNFLNFLQKVTKGTELGLC